MEIKFTLPSISVSELKKKIKNWAQQGLEQTFRDYYTGYNSPFQEKIREQLDQEKLHHGLNVPSLISGINKKLEQEVNAIADRVVAETLVPSFKRLMSREETISTSEELLKAFIETSDNKEGIDFMCSFEKNEKYGWYDVELEDYQRKYKFTLHEHFKNKGLYGILGDSFANMRTPSVDIKLNDQSIKFPVGNYPKDDFFLVLLNMKLFDTYIKITDTDFDEDWFREECTC